MARQRFSAPSTQQTITTFLVATDGTVIGQVPASERMTQSPSGPITVDKQHSSVLLMDGTFWHPGMRNVRLGVCQLCREPPYTFPFRKKPQHGLVSLAPGGGVNCAGCGMILCPAHARRGADSRSRCPSCARGGAFRRFFEWLFWATEED